jgi:lysophospholipase L1-like esterase
MRQREELDGRCCFVSLMEENLPIVCGQFVLFGRSMLFLTVPFLLSAQTYRGSNNPTETRWVASWTASQQLVDSNNALNPEGLRDVTLRQIVHLSLGGGAVRLRLSNRFGSVPLHLTAVHIAKVISLRSEKIIAGSDRALTFSGSSDIVIPAHADSVSDPASLALNSLSDLAITMHIDVAPAEQTGHPGSRETTYSEHGDLVSEVELPGAQTIEHWYFIAGVEVAAGVDSAEIVALGDSITDGHGATTNGNNRWTDVLAERLQTTQETRNVAIVNQGIGGNRLLSDGLGPNALSRFDQDVIAQPGVHYLILLEGINDIGMLTRTGEVSRAEHNELVRRMLAAYQQMLARAHSHDIKVIGATLLPFVGSDFYHPGARSEADRQAVNDWIRDPGHFDAVIDFDKIMRDPEHPDRLLPAFDSGDHLHPSPAGYAAMANAVPLPLFVMSSPPAPSNHGAVVSH